MAHHLTAPLMITAARLRDGDVVYWNKDRWVLMLAEGEVFADVKAGEAALAETMAFVHDNVVIDPYLFEVRLKDGQPVPVKEREIIRAAGPTVHKHTGKQAGQFHAE